MQSFTKKTKKTKHQADKQTLKLLTEISVYLSGN